MWSLTCSSGCQRTHDEAMEASSGSPSHRLHSPWNHRYGYNFASTSAQQQHNHNHHHSNSSFEVPAASPTPIPISPAHSTELNLPSFRSREGRFSLPRPRSTSNMAPSNSPSFPPSNNASTSQPQASSSRFQFQFPQPPRSHFDLRRPASTSNMTSGAAVQIIDLTSDSESPHNASRTAAPSRLPRYANDIIDIRDSPEPAPHRPVQDDNDVVFVSANAIPLNQRRPEVYVPSLFTMYLCTHDNITMW